MSDLLAYFLTWTTYGTWLPGDERGWVHHRNSGIQPPDSQRAAQARKLMKACPVRLSDKQREIASETIRASCRAKGWHVHALNVRSNHVHIVLNAADQGPERAMSFLKAWASRKLNEIFSPSVRQRWWTRHGSTRYIKTAASLDKAIEYVRRQ